MPHVRRRRSPALEESVGIVLKDHLAVDRALEVLAVAALAVVSAKDPCLEALAVLL
jgi:hypothetical protein